MITFRSWMGRGVSKTGIFLRRFKGFELRGPNPEGGDEFSVGNHGTCGKLPDIALMTQNNVPCAGICGRGGAGGIGSGMFLIYCHFHSGGKRRIILNVKEIKLEF